MVDSINAKKTIKQIRRGLSIYRTGRSPFWHARIYDPVKKKYVVRSTKETNRIEAIEVAEEILETYKSKQNSSHATSKDRSFEYYAKLLADLNAQKSKSPCLAPYICPLIFGFSNRVSGAGGRMFNA